MSTIKTCADLKSAIADWLDRDDLTDRIPDFINFAEARIHYGVAQGAMKLEPVRVPAMLTLLQTATSDRHVCLPDNFLETASVTVTTGGVATLDLLAPELFWRMDPGQTHGMPKRFTIEGGQLALSPAPHVSIGLDINYYAKFPALVEDTDTNWLLVNVPEIYLFAALVEASIYTRDRAASEEYLLRYATACITLQKNEIRTEQAIMTSTHTEESLGITSDGSWEWEWQTFDHGKTERSLLRSDHHEVLAPRFNTYGGSWVSVEDDDARVIAAAHDLLTALEALLGDAESLVRTAGYEPTSVVAARSLVARIRGTS